MEKELDSVTVAKRTNRSETLTIAVKKDGSRVSGVPEGKFTEYYDNGAKHFEGNFKDRLRDGKWSCWRPNGKLFYSVLFSRGHKVKELYVADPKEGRPF